MVRSIKGKPTFKNYRDYQDFLDRLGNIDFVFCLAVNKLMIGGADVARKPEGTLVKS